MTEKMGEDLSGGERKLILLVTAVLLFVTIGVFISSYLSKEEPMVRRPVITTKIQLQQLDSKYVITSGLPEGFKLDKVIEEYTSPISGFQYSVLFYKKQDLDYQFIIGGESKEVFEDYFRENEIVEKTNMDMVYKIYKPLQFFWWHEDRLLIVSGPALSGESDALLKFFIERFSPTDKLNI